MNNHSARPALGILSRNVFPSPEIKYVFPIRLRSWDKQDVALVGDHFVHVKQILDNGRLHHIATKADFPSRIRAAQVLGSETPFEPLTEAKECPQRHAHALILTLETSEVAFVTMSHSSNGQDVFHTCYTPLTRQPSALDEPGRLLAVDPYSRAFAVAAPNDNVEIFEMDPRTEWRGPLSSHIRKHWLQKTGMMIAKMDFLYPPESQNGASYLLVIGHKLGAGVRKNRLALELYSWEHPNADKVIAIPQIAPGDLLTGHDMPQMLIPLSRFPGSFVIICNMKLTAYHGAHLGHPVATYNAALNKLNAAAKDFKNYSGRPLWKAWARPARRDPSLIALPPGGKVEESLYLAREDGVLSYLGLTKEGGATHNLGPLNGNVEIAFNHDGRSLGAPDGLIFGGSVSDGGFYQVGGTGHGETREDVMSPQQTDTLYNWAPFIDVAVKYHPTHHTNNEAQQSYHSGCAIYGTSGKAPHGALSQIRYGCEAVVRQVLGDEEDEVFATKLWSYTNTTGVIVVLLSAPGRTDVFYDIFEQRGALSILQMIQDETLAAARVVMRFKAAAQRQGDLLIRVGTSTVSSLFLSRQHDEADMKLVSQLDVENILAAAIEPSERLVVIATLSNLILYRINERDGRPKFDQLGPWWPLETEVTCATFFTFESKVKREDVDMDDTNGFERDVYGAIGTSSGRVFLFSIHDRQRIISLHDISLDARPTGNAAMVASSIAIVTSHEEHEAVLLCGLRDGRVVSISVSPGPGGNGLSVGQQSYTDIGDSAVQLAAHADDHAAAIALCGGRLMRITYRKSISGPPQVDYIYLARQEDRSFSTDSMTATSQAPAEITTDESGYLFCVSEGQLYVIVMDEQSKALPLRLPVPGTPNRVLYSKHFQVFFVASTVYHVHGSKRWSIPTIFVIDPDHGRQAQPLEQLGAGQTITCLTVWDFTKNDSSKQSGPARKNKVYRHIVATTIDTNAEGAKAGSIKFFKIVKDDSGISLERVSEKQEDHPVYSMCQFDNETMVYCCGDRLKMRKYYPEEKKDKRTNLLRISNTNPGVYITASPPFIYVSTATGSFRTFHLDVATSMCTPLYSDSSPRNGLAHLTLPFPVHISNINGSISEIGNEAAAHASPNATLALFTDKNRSITGQLVPPAPSTLATSTTNHPQPLTALFTATLPISLTRLIHANIRPPWKSHPSLPCDLGLPVDQMDLNMLTLFKDILGTATNGSLWSFSVLSDPTFRLLRFVQNLCERDESIASTRVTVTKGSHIEPSTAKPSDMHVNGDILLRIVERTDASAKLEGMLDAAVGGGGGSNQPTSSAFRSEGRQRQRESDVDAMDLDHDFDDDLNTDEDVETRGGPATDYATPAARRARFDELVNGAVKLAVGGAGNDGAGAAGAGGGGDGSGAGSGSGSQSRSQPVAIAVALMRMLLESPL